MAKKTILGILISIIGFVSLVSAHTGNDAFDHCSTGFAPMMSGTFGFGGMFFGWIFSALVLVALVLLVVWLIKQIENTGKRRKK